MRTLNLGILAHVDAGKTSLTERLLHAAGVIDELGSVDAGSTQTDTLALERRRGITIKSAVVSFALGDVTVNLIDTPGHPDFIAEVERVLGVLDGAVLVVSAVEGVQAQTRVLMRALQRLRVPTLIFVNKIDRARRATRARVLRRDRREAHARPRSRLAPIGRRGLAEVLAEHDDALLAAYVDGDASRRRLRGALAEQTRRALVHPVFFGSAITGAGVGRADGGIARAPARRRAATPTARRGHRVQGRARRRRARRSPTCALRSGTLRARDRVALRAARARSPRSRLRARRGRRRARRSRPGAIGKALGARATSRIGDALGARAAGGASATSPRRRSRPSSCPRAPPTAARCTPRSTQLAEQDPLIDLRRDELRGSCASRSTARSRRRSSRPRSRTSTGSPSRFRETTTICIERPAGTGAAVELIDTDDEPVPGHGRPARRPGAGREPA